MTKLHVDIIADNKVKLMGQFLSLTLNEDTCEVTGTPRINQVREVEEGVYRLTADKFFITYNSRWAKATYHTTV